MKTLVLWGKDHQDRAKDLAVGYACECRDVVKAPKSVSGLKRLSYWGHGIPAEFCEMGVDEFIENLKGWKKKNSGLEWVDILTCNGRCTGDGTKSFTDMVRGKMLEIGNASLQGIKLRGLPNPTTPSGKTCNYSILSRDATTKSWSYVAAPGYFDGSSSQHETHMFSAKYFLDQLLKTATGRQSYIHAYTQMMRIVKLTVQDAYAVWKNWDQTKVDDFNARLKEVKEDAFIMVGNSVGSLVWHLQEIK